MCNLIKWRNNYLFLRNSWYSKKRERKYRKERWVVNATTIERTGKSVVGRSWPICTWSSCFMGRTGIKWRKDVLQIQACRDRKEQRALFTQREKECHRRETTRRFVHARNGDHPIQCPPRYFASVKRSRLYRPFRGDTLLLSPFIISCSPPRVSAVFTQL